MFHAQQYAREERPVDSSHDNAATSAGILALAARLLARNGRDAFSEPPCAGMDAVAGLDGVTCAVGEGLDLWTPGLG